LHIVEKANKVMSMIKKIGIVSMLIVLQMTVGTIFCSSFAGAVINNTSDEDCYLIKGVPYAEIKNGLSCDYATIEMVFRYYGVNISSTEVFYFSGGGYSMGYKLPSERIIDTPRRRIPVRFVCNGDLSVGGLDDYKFLGSLFGLSFDVVIPNRVVSHEHMWKEYWNMVKLNIRNNVPVITALDSCAWPLYREWANVTTPISLLPRSCCLTVVVGYNETDSTICVNDQYIGYENGTYRWVKIKDFKLAVSRAYFELRETRYSVYLIKKITEPLPKDVIYDLVHKRNIERMKGDESFYDSVFVTKNFEEFGIDALKSLREEFATKFINQIPAYYFINKIASKISLLDPYPFSRMKRHFSFEAENKHVIAKYLMENANATSYHENDAKLLELEATYWSELTNTTIELKEVLLHHSLVESIKLSKTIIDKITSILDSIIIIDEKIILSN